MTAETLSIILILVLVAMILASLVAGLIGFIKGVYKTVLKTVVKLVFILILVFASPGIANAVGNINISGMTGSSEAVTLQTFIADYLTQTGLVSPTNGLSLYETAIAIANSLVAYGIFFIGMVLTQLLASPITGLIYNGVIRWFLPVENKKDRKAKKVNRKAANLKNGLLDDEGNISETPKRKLPLLRIPGALLGTLQELVFVFVLITPVTALSQTAIRNRETVNDALNASGFDSETVSLVDSYMDTVSKSPLYVLCSGLGMDNAIMNTASKVTLNDTSICLNGLVDSLCDVADPLIKDGTFTFDQGTQALTINFAQLLSVSTIDSLIGKILENPMIMALIPPLIDLAVNSANGTFIADSLDFSNIDWSSELTALNDIYDSVYDSVVSPMLSDEKFTPENFCIYTSTMTDVQIQKLVSAASTLGKMESVRRNLPSLFANAGVFLEKQGVQVLPTDANAYSSVDWSKDLSNLVNIALRFFRTLGIDINSNIDYNDLSQKTFDALGDETKLAEIQSYVTSSDTVTGLVDFDLFPILSIGELVDSALAAVPAIEPYVSEIDPSAILEGYTVEDYRHEFNVIFSIAGMVFSPYSYIDINNIEKTDITKDETTQELVEILDKSEDSRLFQELYPLIMKSFLFNNTFDFSNYLFGLTPYNFNYNSTSFVSDFKEVLTLLPKIMEMTDLLSDDSLDQKTKLESLDVELIADLLSLVTGSDFFNSDVRTGINSYYQKNVNIHTLLSNLFKNEIFASFGLVCPDLETLQGLQWADENQKEGEITKLCSLLKDVQKNSVFITSSDRDISLIEDCDAIGDLIKNGITSDLVKPSILEIIDTSLNKYLKDMGFTLSLDQMRNEMWVDDSERVGKLLALLKDLDYANMNFSELDPDLFNAVLTNLSLCHFIQTSNTYEDPFGYALYKMLYTQNFYGVLGISYPDVSAFDMIKGDTEWSSETVTQEINGIEVEITSVGEIKDLCSFLSLTQKYSFDELVGGKLPEGFIADVSEYMGSNLLKNIFTSFLAQTVKKVNMGSSYQDALDSIDFSIMEDMTKDEITAELNMFDIFYSLSQQQYESESKLTYMMSHLYSLNTCLNDDGTTLLDDFDTLMDKLKSSKLMNTLKEGEAYTPIQYLFIGIVQESGFESKVTLSESSKSSIELKAIVNSVLDWEEEIGHVKDIVYQMQGINPDTFDITKDELSYDQALALFTEMNESTVFHRVPIYLFKSAFEDNDVDSLLINPDTNTVTHPMQWYVHLSASREDIEYWENDLTHLLNIVLGDNGLKELFLADDVTLDDIDFNTVKLDFLYDIGTCHLFDGNRSYLLYNIFDRNTSDDYDVTEILHKASMTPYGENSYAYRFEELFFQNPKLVDSDNVLIKEKALNDLHMLQSVIGPIMNNADKIAKATKASDVELSFETLTNASISFTDGINDFTGGTYYRSDITSEIVAGLIKVLMHNASFASYLGNCADLDFFASEYQLVNTIEGRAIDGILDFLKLTASSKEIAGISISYYTKAQLGPVFMKLGLEDSSLVETDSDKFSIFLAQDYFSVGNAKVSIAEKDVLSSIPVWNTTSDSMDTLSSHWDLETDLNSKSFRQILADVVDIE